MKFESSDRLTPGLANVLRESYVYAFDEKTFEGDLQTIGPKRLADMIIHELWMKGVHLSQNKYIRGLHVQMLSLEKTGYWDLKALKAFA